MRLILGHTQKIIKTNMPQVVTLVCQMCETTKTPQWRCGPNGTNTLCNRCGLKWRKGRRGTMGLIQPNEVEDIEAFLETLGQPNFALIKFNKMFH